MTPSPPEINSEGLGSPAAIVILRVAGIEEVLNDCVLSRAGSVSMDGWWGLRPLLYTFLSTNMISLLDTSASVHQVVSLTVSRVRTSRCFSLGSTLRDVMCGFDSVHGFSGLSCDVLDFSTLERGHIPVRTCSPVYWLGSHVKRIALLILSVYQGSNIHRI